MICLDEVIAVSFLNGSSCTNIGFAEIEYVCYQQTL